MCMYKYFYRYTHAYMYIYIIYIYIYNILCNFDLFAWRLFYLMCLGLRTKGGRRDGRKADATKT